MVSNIALNRFTDFDRLLLRKNFLVTIIGSVLAYLLSNQDLGLPETWINFEFFGLPAIPPYKLSLSIAIVVCIAAYTRNIASSALVGIVGAIGLMSPVGDGSIDWILGYIIIILTISIVIGILSDRLRLVMDWVDFYLITAFIFAVFIIAWGIFANSFREDYSGYKLGSGGDFDTGLGFPIIEIFALLGILVLLFITMIITNGQLILTPGSAKRFKIFGYIFLITGQAISLISIILFSDKISQKDMLAISDHDKHLKTISDLFSHHSSGNYGIIIYPSNIFIAAAYTTVFTAIGISLLIIGNNKGNIEGMRGGSDFVFLTAPLGTFIFLTGGSYYLQNLFYPGGFYIAEELTPMITTMLWSVLIFNQLIARIILLFLDRFFPNR